MNWRELRPVRSVRRMVSTHPVLYFPIARAIGNKRLMDESTDLVVDGYPRSANSYIEAAFEYSQRARGISLATHTHAAAQILRAAKQGSPTVVLIRQPDEAIASVMAMQADPRVEESFRDYVAFYRPILPLREKIVVAEFSVVVSRFDEVVRAVNAKFKTDLNIPAIGPEFEAGVKNERDRISRERVGRVPNYSDAAGDKTLAARRARQDRLIESIRSPSGSELKQVREEALDLFGRFAGTSHVA